MSVVYRSTGGTRGPTDTGGEGKDHTDSSKSGDFEKQDLSGYGRLIF